MQEYNIGDRPGQGPPRRVAEVDRLPRRALEDRPELVSPLVEQIKSAQAAGGTIPSPRLQLYLLFWDHGTAWAERGLAQRARLHRPLPSRPRGSRVDDALLAQPRRHRRRAAGRLRGRTRPGCRQAGVEVYRLAGKDEADTKRMLDELAQKGTPWPGRARSRPAAAAPRDLTVWPDGVEQVPFPDEWTMPDDWILPRPRWPRRIRSRPRPPIRRRWTTCWAGRSRRTRPRRRRSSLRARRRTARSAAAGREAAASEGRQPLPKERQQLPKDRLQ